MAVDPAPAQDQTAAGLVHTSLSVRDAEVSAADGEILRGLAGRVAGLACAGTLAPADDWGMAEEYHKTDAAGSYAWDSPLRDYAADIPRLHAPRVLIDEEATGASSAASRGAFWTSSTGWRRAGSLPPTRTAPTGADHGSVRPHLLRLLLAITRGVPRGGHHEGQPHPRAQPGEPGRLVQDRAGGSRARRAVDLLA